MGVRHLAVMLDSDVIGYGIGSYLGASWAAFVHAKGDNEYNVPPYTYYELSKLYPNREWINTGDAEGLPGLAWFKERFTLNAADKQMKIGWIQL